MAHHIGFRLAEDRDPEERLEAAALWKAMYDHHGPERISALLSSEDAPDDWILFGRQRGQFQTGQEPVSDHLPYWNDPAFIDNCGRDFELASYDGLPAAVARLHGRGRPAFLKSTKIKHFTLEVPVGAELWEAIGDMAYSFMDGGPDIMVQEWVEMEFEHRFFVVGRKIVTSSPVMVSLTPLDHPLPAGAGYRTPGTRALEIDAIRHAKQKALVEAVAARMLPPHAVVDVAMIGSRPVVIEMNPMVLGQVGLFASSVRALAIASDELMQDFVPSHRLPFAHAEPHGDDDGEEWVDASP